MNETNKNINDDENEEPETPFDDAVIEWTAPEYIQHEKGVVWYLFAGVALVLLLIYAIFTANWTLALALVVISAVYYWMHGFNPKNIKVKISRVGIQVNDKRYPYQNIDSFWIIYKPPHVKTLNLKSNSRFLPDITIQLNDQDPSEVREYLASQIREQEGKEETFVDSVIRLLKL